MKALRIMAGIAAATLVSSCIQMSQQAAGPIPPPAPETLRRPIPPALQHYYTLPEPVKQS